MSTGLSSPPARCAIPARLARRLRPGVDRDDHLHSDLDGPMSDVPGATAGNRGAERHADARGRRRPMDGAPGFERAGRGDGAVAGGISDHELQAAEVSPC